MDQQLETNRRLADLVAQPEADLNLAEAALLIASSEYPALDVTRYLARFDRMAETIGKRLSGPFSPGRIILELNRFLFDEEGFAGNIQDYFDPRNSFLNDVLERKLGIPISLAVIYLEVGQRLGLPLGRRLLPRPLPSQAHRACRGRGTGPLPRRAIPQPGRP